jgi:hypothetical protein
MKCVVLRARGMLRKSRDATANLGHEGFGLRRSASPATCWESFLPPHLSRRPATSPSGSAHTFESARNVTNQGFNFTLIDTYSSSQPGSHQNGSKESLKGDRRVHQLLHCAPSSAAVSPWYLNRAAREKGDFNKKSKFLNVHQRKNLR